MMTKYTNKYVRKNPNIIFTRLLLIELLIFVYNAMACTVIFNSTSSDYDSIKKDITYIHNAYRNIFVTAKSYYPIATYMLYVEWDEELAKKAQEVAANCPAESICEVCEENKEFKIIQAVYNQDLIKSYGSYTNREDFTALAMNEKQYVEEKKLFDPKTIKLTREEDVGFWSNIIRATTWKIGCGAAYTLIDGNKKLWYICNYRIIKSETDGKLYEPGEHSCDNCPKNTACDRIENYPMLCAAAKDKTPIIGTPIIGTESNLLLNCQLELNEDSEDCSIEKSSFGDWLKNKHENDIIQKVSLNKNDFSSILFSKNINVENGGCFVFEYKQENIHDDTVTTVFGFAILTTNGDKLVKVNTTETAKEWKKVSLNIEWETKDINVGVGVHTSSNGNADQEETIIMIKNPKVYGKICKSITI